MPALTNGYSVIAGKTIAAATAEAERTSTNYGEANERASSFYKDMNDKAMTGAMGVMTAGDLTIAIPASSNTDEIGDMAKALAVFRDGLLDARRLAEAQEVERVAKEQRAVAIETMTRDFDAHVSGMLNIVAGALTELEATAQAMASTSEQTSGRATTAAAVTEQASSSVGTVATAAEELTSSIKEIGRQVELSSRTSQAPSEEAARTSETVKSLAESSTRIGDVVRLINDIATQTNLLALNVQRGGPGARAKSRRRLSA